MKKALFFCLVLAAAGCTSTPTEPVKPLEGWRPEVKNVQGDCNPFDGCMPGEIQDMKDTGE